MKVLHSHCKTQATLQGIVKETQNEECKKYTDTRQRLLIMGEGTTLRIFFS